MQQLKKKLTKKNEVDHRRISKIQCLSGGWRGWGEAGQNKEESGTNILFILYNTEIKSIYTLPSPGER